MLRSAIVGAVIKKREREGGIGGAESDQTISRKHHTPAWMFERNRKGRGPPHKNWLGLYKLGTSRSRPRSRPSRTVINMRLPFARATFAIPSVMSANSASPPPSPRTSTSRLSLYNISNAFIRIRRVRQDRGIVSTSGPEPLTHPSLDNVEYPHKVSVRREDHFVCASGVDVPKLLRACRSTLLDQARAIGANVLVDEQYVTAWPPPPIFAYDHSQMVHHHHIPKEPR